MPLPAVTGEPTVRALDEPELNAEEPFAYVDEDGVHVVDDERL